MTGSATLSQALLKVERANHHILDFENAVKAIFDLKPYSLVRENDVQAQKIYWKIQHIDERLPITLERLNVIVGDCLHNLRSALDYLAAALAPKGIPDKTSFPIWGKDPVPTAKQMESLMSRVIKGAGKDIFDAVHAIRPYNGTDPRGRQLWIINRLNNTDKHRLLLTTIFRNKGLVINQDDFGIASDFPKVEFSFVLNSADRDPLVEGAIMFSAPLNYDKDPQLVFEVAFDEVIVKGEPVIKALVDFREAVSETIGLFGVYV